MLLPRITIVTPSYNQAQYLPETIDSVLSQDYPNLEYIVIDGGSTDGSVDIIREHAGRLTYWVSEKDRGQSHAIMKGLDRCAGELFTWVNSDDVLFPGCLDAIATCYRENGMPDIVHANAAYIDAEGMVTRFVRVPRQSRFFFRRGVWNAAAPAIFFKTASFRAVGGLNEEFHQAMDLDIWARMLKGSASIAHVPQYLGAFRWHERSKSFASFVASGTRVQNTEVTQVFSQHLPHSRPATRLIWRRIYKMYQVLNLNYIFEYIDRKRLRSRRHWKEAISARYLPRHSLGCRSIRGDMQTEGSSDLE